MTSALLNSTEANLNVALTASAGSFKINGVEIKYDAAQDSLNNVINRINTSAANVVASYDSINDQLKLSARNTGSTLIDL
jgi:archaellum component FlaF (FlaF/FlaG flagellin family)